jgi:hypothetical protein
MGVADEFFVKDIILKGFWMRIDDFEGQYAHGFSIALDPVLCRAGLKEPAQSGFASFRTHFYFTGSCKTFSTIAVLGSVWEHVRRCVI